MNAKVVKGKVIHGEKHVLTGEIVTGLSPEDHANLIKLGLVVACDEGDEIPEEDSDSEDSEDPESKPKKKK